MNREEWLKERRKGIGGSDAAAVLGLHPYMTNVELWEIKTGRKQKYDVSDETAVLYGTKAEEHIRELVKLDHIDMKVFYSDCSSISNIEYPFIRGSFDGKILHVPSEEWGVLEIKTSNIKNSLMLKKWDNKIPQNYYIQVLHYMLVDETFRFGLVKALLKLEYAKQNNGLFDSVPSEFREYFINRNDEQVQADLKYLLEKEIEFWRYVENDKRPPLILPEI